MWTTLGREQKIAFSLLIVLGISGLFLGTVYFKNRVKISLSQPISKNNQFVLKEDSTLALQSRDTDNDSLSDYDELYFYGTSPFIEDTDSDGYLDKEEIDDGEDPNCVRGKICGGSIIGERKTGFENIKPPEGELEIQNPLDAIKGLSVSQLRSLLQKSGATPEMLNQISDSDLETIYKQTLGEIEEIESIGQPE